MLSENNVAAILVNSCCYDYDANASEAVQKISTRALLFTATPMKKAIFKTRIRGCGHGLVGCERLSELGGFDEFGRFGGFDGFGGFCRFDGFSGFGGFDRFVF